MSNFNIIRSDSKQENAFFNIDEYYFYRSLDDNEYKVIEHTILVDLQDSKDYSYNDIISILKDIDQSPAYTNVDLNKNNDEQEVYLKWITNSPKEEYEYIREYESEIHENDNVLFHDFMKKYIEICKYEDPTIDCAIVFIGYTLINNCFEIKIKAFNYKILNNIIKKIVDQFLKKQCIVKTTNLNWTRLEGFIVGENSDFRCDESDKLLKNTLKESMSEVFKFLLYKIDKEGYINLKFNEIKDNENEIKIKKEIDKFKQLHGLLKPYLKLFINNQFMYLHDEPSIDLKDEKNNRIFSFSPRLMQYYQKQWFEDFIGKILRQIKDDYKEFDIKATMSNKIFNFYNDSKKEHNIEIDWIIDVEKDGVSKTIGIECKKTLKKTYYDETKNKLYEKVVKSGKAIIDGYIVAGYFKEQSFSSDFTISQENEYKPEVLFDENEYSEEDVFVLYMAVCDTNILDIKNKIIKCIELVYINN